jgi:transposase-like protein
VWHTYRITTRLGTNPYKRHRFPTKIISHCVWLYFRFCLSYRDVEEPMAARGVVLTYEAVRYWCRKFGQAYANHLSRRRPRPGDKWHLDEVFLSIHGEQHYLTENSHQPKRQRECWMQRFKSPGHAQRFLAAYGPIAQHFRPRWHRFSASAYRQEMRHRFHTWQDITSHSTAA